MNGELSALMRRVRVTGFRFLAKFGLGVIASFAVTRWMVFEGARASYECPLWTIGFAALFGLWLYDFFSEDSCDCRRRRLKRHNRNK